MNEPTWTSWDWEWTEQMAEHKTAVRRIKEAFDSILMETAPSLYLRAENGRLPYSVCEVTETMAAEAFPCLEVKYWPNGKG